MKSNLRLLLYIPVLAGLVSALLTWNASTRHDRARIVLDCILAMEHAAPLDVTQANPDYGFEAAALWCDGFVDRGGRGFGALVTERAESEP